MRRVALAAAAATCLAVGSNAQICQDENGDEVELVPPAGCDPSSRSPGDSGCFTQSGDAFGVTVWATAETPAWAFEYALALTREFLDSDEDGVVVGALSPSPLLSSRPIHS